MQQSVKTAISQLTITSIWTLAIPKRAENLKTSALYVVQSDWLARTHRVQ